MYQPTLSDNGFEKFRKKTRKEQFPDEMEVIIPWQDLTSAIEPFYPQPEGAGRRPVEIERMLQETMPTKYVLPMWPNRVLPVSPV